MGGKTILAVQSELEAALQSLPSLLHQLPDALKPLANLAPPKGVRAQVSLRHAGTNRQVKRNAPVDAWSPESGLVAISYDASAGEETSPQPSPPDAGREMTPSPASPAEDPVRDLVLALADAENDPQRGFVSLKWFRDTFVPQRAYPWATATENRQGVLVQAIERKWILTSKVPNPKNPQYPVTAIRLNRPLAEVRAILGRHPGSDAEFAPITIPGELLSETVLRSRR
jgi:hypothetical protein